jgi:hypothetical protein
VCRRPLYRALDRSFLAVCLVLAGALPGVMVSCAPAAAPERPFFSGLRVPGALVLTQLPAGTDLERQASASGGTLRASFGDGARLLLVFPDGSVRVLTRGFYGACDAEVSFDAERILFAGKRGASDNWNIYEVRLDGSHLGQITKNLGDCRSPAYQSTLYTLTSPQPWYQLTFVGNAADTMNEYGATVATHLYSCKLDGSAVRRLTFNLSSDMDPFLMPDGRLLLASWQRCNLDWGILGRVGLFGINLDGTDYALFAGSQGRRVKHMPCVTAGGLLVFVEADEVPWDGAGCLSCVQMRRPLDSYRPITGSHDGLFCWPSPLPDGSVLVARRPRDAGGTHGVYRLDPSSGKYELLFDDPRYHDIQAKLIQPRSEPDGRSSVVTESDPHGKLYCLNVCLSDLKQREWMPPAVVKRVRVLEGIPLTRDEAGAYLPAEGTHVRPMESRPGSTVNGLPPMAQRRILGEVDIEEDGSLNIEVPANTPIQLQLLDAGGLALRSCDWIWAKNHEPRGCIGCHEDGELTPENVLTRALQRPSISLCLPPGRRRTVDFRRDVMPIIAQKCVGCHGPGQAPPRLDGGLTLLKHAGGRAYFNRAYESLLEGLGDWEISGSPAHPLTLSPRHPLRPSPRHGLEGPQDAAGCRGKYVHPGRARTSPLIWHVFGRNTSRGWDGSAASEPIKAIPPENSPPLSADEKRTFAEWIDMGARWDGIPRDDKQDGRIQNAERRLPD